MAMKLPATAVNGTVATFTAILPQQAPAQASRRSLAGKPNTKASPTPYGLCEKPVSGGERRRLNRKLKDGAGGRSYGPCAEGTSPPPATPETFTATLPAPQTSTSGTSARSVAASVVFAAMTLLSLAVATL